MGRREMSRSQDSSVFAGKSYRFRLVASCGLEYPGINPNRLNSRREAFAVAANWTYREADFLGTALGL